jgi:hypothetical protein
MESHTKEYKELRKVLLDPLIDHNLKIDKRFDVVSFELIQHFSALTDSKARKDLKVDPHVKSKDLQEAIECDICRHRFLKRTFFKKGSYAFSASLRSSL